METKFFSHYSEPSCGLQSTLVSPGKEYSVCGIRTAVLKVTAHSLCGSGTVELQVTEYSVCGSGTFKPQNILRVEYLWFLMQWPE